MSVPSSHNGPVTSELAALRLDLDSRSRLENITAVVARYEPMQERNSTAHGYQSSCENVSNFDSNKR
nr:hypothetical protein CFP56_22042 [Quercus suber]